MEMGVNGRGLMFNNLSGAALLVSREIELLRRLR
jgi:hypothetical protein